MALSWAQKYASQPHVQAAVARKNSKFKLHAISVLDNGKIKYNGKTVDWPTGNDALDIEIISQVDDNYIERLVVSKSEQQKYDSDATYELFNQVYNARVELMVGANIGYLPKTNYWTVYNVIGLAATPTDRVKNILDAILSEPTSNNNETYEIILGYVLTTLEDRDIILDFIIRANNVVDKFPSISSVLSDYLTKDSAYELALQLLVSIQPFDYNADVIGPSVDILDNILDGYPEIIESIFEMSVQAKYTSDQTYDVYRNLLSRCSVDIISYLIEAVDSSIFGDVELLDTTLVNTSVVPNHSIDVLWLLLKTYEHDATVIINVIDQAVELDLPLHLDVLLNYGDTSYFTITDAIEHAKKRHSNKVLKYLTSGDLPDGLKQ